jgi:hypothetical protein
MMRTGKTFYRRKEGLDAVHPIQGARSLHLCRGGLGHGGPPAAIPIPRPPPKHSHRSHPSFPLTLRRLSSPSLSTGARRRFERSRVCPRSPRIDGLPHDLVPSPQLPHGNQAHFPRPRPSQSSRRLPHRISECDLRIPASESVVFLKPGHFSEGGPSDPFHMTDSTAAKRSRIPRSREVSDWPETSGKERRQPPRVPGGGADQMPMGRPIARRECRSAGATTQNRFVLNG